MGNRKCTAWLSSRTDLLCYCWLAHASWRNTMIDWLIADFDPVFVVPADNFTCKILAARHEQMAVRKTQELNRDQGANNCLDAKSRRLIHWSGVVSGSVEAYSNYLFQKPGARAIQNFYELSAGVRERGCRTLRTFHTTDISYLFSDLIYHSKSCCHFSAHAFL